MNMGKVCARYFWLKLYCTIKILKKGNDRIEKRLLELKFKTPLFYFENVLHLLLNFDFTFLLNQIQALKKL